MLYIGVLLISITLWWNKDFHGLYIQCSPIYCDYQSNLRDPRYGYIGVTYYSVCHFICLDTIHSIWWVWRSHVIVHATWFYFTHTRAPKPWVWMPFETYRQLSNIRRTKSQIKNVSRPIHWSQLFSRELRCWSSADGRCSKYIWVIDQFIAYWGAAYIRDLTVYAKFIRRMIYETTL